MMSGAMENAGLTERQISANNPIARFADPREVAEAIVWLCSDRASYVTGQTLLVDGGMTV